MFLSNFSCEASDDSVVNTRPILKFYLNVDELLNLKISRKNCVNNDNVKALKKKINSMTSSNEPAHP